MIDTEIFEYESPNNYTCFEEVLKMVNELIKDKGIKKEDIVEYRTDNWSSKEEGIEYWHYKATISWFKSNMSN